MNRVLGVVLDAFDRDGATEPLGNVGAEEFELEHGNGVRAHALSLYEGKKVRFGRHVIVKFRGGFLPSFSWP